MNFVHRSIAFCSIASLLLAGCANVSPQPSPQATSPIRVNPTHPQIPNRTFNLKDFGGNGDGKTWNTDVFTKAFAEIGKQGGGRLVVPAGTYRTKPIVLVSNLDLHLDAGAVILAPGTFTDYDLPEPETLKTQQDVQSRVRAPAPLITGRNLHDVAITGEGAVDGNGAIWWAWSERAARAQPGRLVYPRPNLVSITECQRLLVQDVTFRDSPKFHLVPNASDLLIERIKVRAPANAPNTDAIDPTSCANMLIRDCDLDTGDDNVAIKTGGTNLLIEDCNIKRGHGISIGSGTTGGISNMLVRHCTFDGTDNGIRIKSMRGAGGLVENIRFTDITMNNVANAIVLDLLYVDNNRPNFVGDPTKVPSIHNVLIDHVNIRSAKSAGKFVGLPDSHITDITLRDVQINADKDFVIKDADKITFERVNKQIKTVTP
ncbi:MAG TPA: glycoside hydrolase family 28 protein [Tepidisphaeraceae bacterium]|nr:glycoside hydrolase family 28 protein [Tepidisphaeraceae bacterium]